MTTKKRMSGMTKLSDFGKTNPIAPEPTSEPVIPLEEPLESKPIKVLDDNEIKQLEPKSLSALEPKPIKPKSKEVVTVNIKITREQQDWLADTSRQVRDNNTSPVPAPDRVYPQHLIQVAIDLLHHSGVNWEQVRNVEELRQHLNL